MYKECIYDLNSTFYHQSKHICSTTRKNQWQIPYIQKEIMIHFGRYSYIWSWDTHTIVARSNMEIQIAYTLSKIRKTKMTEITITKLYTFSHWCTLRIIYYLKIYHIESLKPTTTSSTNHLLPTDLLQWTHYISCTAHSIISFLLITYTYKCTTILIYNIRVIWTFSLKDERNEDITQAMPEDRQRV